LCTTAFALAACGGSGHSTSSGPTSAPDHDASAVGNPNGVDTTNGGPTSQQARDSGGPAAPDAGEDSGDANDSGLIDLEASSSGFGFPCGQSHCDPASEFCIGAADSLQCVRIPQGCSAAGACSCLNLTIGGRTWRCSDNNGAVVVTPP
jgi:hypothetical protein